MTPAEQLMHYDPAKAPASPTASDSSRTSGVEQKHSPRSSRHSGHSGSPESGRHQRAPPSPTSSQGSSTAAGDASRISGPVSPGQHDVWEKQPTQQRAASPPRHSGTAPPSSTAPNPFRTSATASSPTARIQQPDYPPPRAPTTPGHSNPFATANNPFMEPGNPFAATQQASVHPSSTTYPVQVSPTSRLSDQTGQQPRADAGRPPSGPAPVLQRPGVSPPYPPVRDLRPVMYDQHQQRQVPGSRDYRDHQDRSSPGQGSVDSYKSTSTTGLFYITITCIACFSIIGGACLSSCRPAFCSIYRKKKHLNGITNPWEIPFHRRKDPEP